MDWRGRASLARPGRRRRRRPAGRLCNLRAAETVYWSGRDAAVKMTDRRDVDGRGVAAERSGPIKTSGRKTNRRTLNGFNYTGSRDSAARFPIRVRHTLQHARYNDTRSGTIRDAERVRVGAFGGCRAAQVSPGEYYDVPAGNVIKRHRQWISRERNNTIFDNGPFDIRGPYVRTRRIAAYLILPLRPVRVRIRVRNAVFPHDRTCVCVYNVYIYYYSRKVYAIGTHCMPYNKLRTTVLRAVRRRRGGIAVVAVPVTTLIRGPHTNRVN